MAYSETLASRIREMLARKRGFTEKAMFGGVSFLFEGKMFCGVLNDDLVVRVNPEDSEILLQKQHVRPMDFTGRPMKGFLYISPAGYKTDRALLKWITMSIDFVSSLTVRNSGRQRKIKS
ncbi:MAG: TfoX/Sxy family protein [Ignavibacteria bacterium]|nr:TfoX/Sxy family protein [Ignavibacteria bacterium]MBI3764961.1 TfoX/Sxy family protein [Ignavibacteriales bacterium]